jgi:protein involved in polysaccharide export with SLBB domain
MNAGRFGFLMAIVLSGCATRNEGTSAGKNLISAGDQLIVVCTNRKVPQSRCVVSSAGEITLPLIGRLHVAGMTTSEAAQAIALSQRPSWPTDPQFSVSKATEK